MSHTLPISTRRTLGTVALLTATALALPVAALAGPGGGPRASVDIATVCTLDGTTFSIDVIVRNKSDKVDAIVNEWSTEAVFKDRDLKGPNVFAFAPPLRAGASGIAVAVGDGVVFGASFSLCDPEGGIRSELGNARGLNGESSVLFGPNGREIMNRCSDDPATEDVIEPNGIKLSLADIAAIDAACQ